MRTQQFFFCRATLVVGTPSMFLDLIEKQNELKFSINSLQMVQIGGSLVSSQLVKKVQEILKVTNINVMCFPKNYI